MDDAIGAGGSGIAAGNGVSHEDPNLTSDQRRKQWAFSSGRSYSAPPRKKWYRRGPLRRMGSQHSMLYDQMVSRRLVGAITAWHDLHSTLLQLSSEKRSLGGSEPCTLEGTPASSSSPSPSDEVFSSDDFGESDKDDGLELDDAISIADDDIEGGESDDTLDEIVEFEKKSRLNGKLSLSNPELTSIQLKQMFPELSEQWRLVLTKVKH